VDSKQYMVPMMPSVLFVSLQIFFKLRPLDVRNRVYIQGELTGSKDGLTGLRGSVDELTGLRGSMDLGVSAIYDESKAFGFIIIGAGDVMIGYGDLVR
jgi:hypothetical protein